ncbi:hypothetical protein [Lentzea sp. NPDC051838]|uniref:hypothetical protein n=1 Tax=Lentzea sp. NPDC051838 TaxID=3154849 RepID=UPI0034291125
MAVVTAAAAVVLGTVGVYAMAQDAPNDQQPSLVEDFAYPGADKILAEKGITLLKGDGHILLENCVTNATGQIALRSSQHAEPICFKVTGATGWLSLSIPEVYSIKGDGHKGEAKITTDEGATTRTEPIKVNNWTPINSGDGGTLLELKAWS